MVTIALESTSATTTYRRILADGVNIFYREAGVGSASTLVLLHGFPSSSREFDSLIRLLATPHHVVAPDFPGFGQSEAPPPSSYSYTFDRLSSTTTRFLEQLGIEQYSLYLHDYGGPVGFRMMQLHPERLRALIIQNANAWPTELGIPKSLRPLSLRQPPSSATLWALRDLNDTIPTRGRMNSPFFRGPAKAKSKLNFCTTIEAM